MSIAIGDSNDDSLTERTTIYACLTRGTMHVVSWVCKSYTLHRSGLRSDDAHDHIWQLLKTTINTCNNMLSANFGIDLPSNLTNSQPKA
jgi:hypothetical protein